MGANIKRISQKAKKVSGVDYSIESLNLSKEVNEENIREGKVEALEGNVAALPFDDDSFDIVTPFETVYFWPDIEKSFGEVKRMLKPGGTFLIGMETNGSDSLVMRFWNHFIDMEMYAADEISSFLANNNYTDITAYLSDGKNKQEIIKSNGEERRISDDYSNISFSGKFVQWVTVTAVK